jgi:hypothetical protein
MFWYVKECEGFTLRLRGQTVVATESSRGKPALCAGSLGDEDQAAALYLAVPRPFDVAERDALGVNT